MQFKITRSFALLNTIVLSIGFILPYFFIILSLKYDEKDSFESIYYYKYALCFLT